MMRFYRNMVERMTVTLLHQLIFRGDTIATLARDVRDSSYGHTAAERSYLNELCERLSQERGGATSAEMAKDLLSRLMNEEAGEGDLIDQVVAILQLPYPRNVLGNNTIRTLQNAILRPDELSALQAVRTTERQCGGCSHTFSQGEMCSWVRGGSAGESPTLLCVRCFKPERIHCSQCVGSAALPKKVFSMLSKMPFDCGHHSSAAAAGVESEPSAPDAPSQVVPAEVPFTERLFTTRRMLRTDGPPVARPSRGGVAEQVREATRATQEANDFRALDDFILNTGVGSWASTTPTPNTPPQGAAVAERRPIYMSWNDRAEATEAVLEPEDR